MTALQWILKEAKKLKKQYPKRFTKWTEYVAQASAIYSSKHKGKSPVGKKRKKVSGVKDSAKVRSELKKKGLKMPHGYETIKRKRKIGSVKKKKISEQSILNKIHKVKEDVSALDELQHKHMIGRKIKIGSLPVYKDKEAAREIQLFADNDYMLYQQRKRPILINLGKKYKKGTYDIHKAAKLWRYYIDAAMQKYHKEFGSRGKWSNLLSVPDRNLLALDYAIETKNEFDLGNFTI